MPQEHTLMTGRCGRLRGRLWVDDAEAKGVVIVVHGLGDHSARYSGIAEQLMQHGWFVFAFDQQGHGLSPGKRGHADSYEGLLADIACARRLIRERMPHLPQVLWGHSMGGNLAINYALRQREFHPEAGGLLGLLLVAPLLLPSSPLPRPLVLAAWMTGHLIPRLRVHRKRRSHRGRRDVAPLERVDSDALQHRRLSIYLATQLLAQGRWALDHARDLRGTHFLTIVGDEDDLVDRAACEQVCIRAAGEFASWPRRGHDLVRDNGSEEIVRRLTAWLQHAHQACA